MPHQIQCPKCQAVYTLPKVPPATATLHCKRCNTTFRPAEAAMPAQPNLSDQLQPLGPAAGLGQLSAADPFAQPIGSQPMPGRDPFAALQAAPLQPQPAAPAASGGGIDGWKIGLAIGGGVIVLLLVVVIVMMSRGNPTTTPPVATLPPTNPIPPPVVPNSPQPPVPVPATPLANTPNVPISNPGDMARIRELKPVAEKKQLLYGWKSGEKYRYGFERKTEGEDPSGPGGEIGVVEYEVDPKVAGAASEKQQASGTAFVVHSGGLLMTCHHVVAGASSVKVHLENKVYPADVVALDKANDLAILRIQADHLPALPLANSSNVRLAEDVMAIGFPLSDVLGRSVKITSGAISGKDSNRDVLQVDITINPGNSGGPLLNMRGEIVGVNSAGLFGSGIQEVSFAVPSNTGSRLLRKLGVSPDAPAGSGTLSRENLAAKATPSTAFVEVELGAESAAMLSFTGNSKSTGTSTNPPQQITSRVITSLSGQLMAVQGDAPLGLGLGTFGSLVFEHLPEESQTKWEDKQISAIFVKGTSNRRFRILIEQSVVYEVKSNDDKQLVVTKTITGNAVGQAIAKVNGTGTWVFDRNTGVPVSMDMQVNSQITVEGQQSNLNSTVHYERVGSPGTELEFAL